ncbi:zf-DNL-domain-containing protein [Mytilinidion resinicola]|uniref:Zf-DNL-domain-containing protein n=1 Tax=Mytilinidion resinicola TaxID=574789 RepID=A0A6A6YG46_9PEZI|nr:zf-DNL-domain-containing protein [Mytilinidion resinicola]KAF2807710.1 zf-DNL-domain-containing protein [Mytilinidion resinicola]
MNSSRNVLRMLAQKGVPPNTWTPRSELSTASKRLFHPPRTAIPRRPQIPILPQRPILSRARYESTATPPSAQPPAVSPGKSPESRLERDKVPSYDMTFTCKKCDTRSSHRISKQGYFHGTVLVTCPGCKNRHLIADHLKIFSDKSVTIEDLMREKGQLVRRGSLTAEGDVEMWPDETTTPEKSAKEGKTG